MKNPVQTLRNFINYQREALLDHAFGNGTKPIWKQVRVGIENLCIVLRATYPLNDNDFCEDWRDQLPAEKKFLSKLNDRNWGKNLHDMLDKGLHEGNLCILLERPPYVITLQYLQPLLLDAGYRLRCSQQEILRVSRDYLYIKAIRNMTNHANSEETEDQEQLMNYLERFGYMPLSQINTQELKTVILEAVDALETLGKGSA